MRGTCHKAQITPERTAVAVNESRLANSGTRNPRQPISSPRVVAQFWITPMVATTRKYSPIPRGLDNGPRPKKREKASAVWVGFNAAMPVNQATEYVKL